MQIEVDCRHGRVEKTVDEAHCALQAIPRPIGPKRLEHTLAVVYPIACLVKAAQKGTLATS